MVPIPLPFKNVSGEVMPPGALFVVSPAGVEVETGALQAVKVATTHAPDFYVNGPTTVGTDGYGVATAVRECIVAYDQGSPAPVAGTELGPVAGSWYAAATGRGLVAETDGTAGLVNALRVGSRPVPQIMAGRLTEDPSVLPESLIGQTINAAGNWEDIPGSEKINAAWPVELLPGVPFTPRPLASVLYWEQPVGSGRYAFLPLQFAEGDYPGFVSTGDQSWNGVKTFATAPMFSHFPLALNAADTVTVGLISIPFGNTFIHNDVDPMGDAYFGSTIVNDSAEMGVDETWGSLIATVTIAGGWVFPTVPAVHPVLTSVPHGIECGGIGVRDYWGGASAPSNFGSPSLGPLQRVTTYGVGLNVGRFNPLDPDLSDDWTAWTVTHSPVDLFNFNLGGFGGIAPVGKSPGWGQNNAYKVAGGVLWSLTPGNRPLLAANNTFTGAQAVTGDVSVTAALVAAAFNGAMDPTDMEAALVALGGVDLSL